MDYAKLIDRCIKMKTQKLAWAQQCVKIRSQSLACEQQLVKMRSQQLTTDQQAENLRTLRLRNNLLESQVEYNRKMTDTFYAQYAREMNPEASNSVDARGIARMRQLFLLQNSGLRNILAISDPIEVKDLFPEPTYNNFVYDVARQLTDAGYINSADIETV